MRIWNGTGDGDDRGCLTGDGRAAGQPLSEPIAAAAGFAARPVHPGLFAGDADTMRSAWDKTGQPFRTVARAAP